MVNQEPQRRRRQITAAQVQMLGALKENIIRFLQAWLHMEQFESLDESLPFFQQVAARIAQRCGSLTGVPIRAQRTAYSPQELIAQVETAALAARSFFQAVTIDRMYRPRSARALGRLWAVVATAALRHDSGTPL